MFFMVVDGNDINQVLEALPTEIVSRLDFLLILVKALGGLFVLYLVFFGIRTYFLREQTKMIKQMRKDISVIKRKLKIK